MRGKYMINISFAKWFLENDTFTISLFNNSINESKEGEERLTKDMLDYYTGEIKYRVKQFADRLKDKEKIKEIIDSKILEDIRKQKNITNDELIEDIHKAANNYKIDDDKNYYASFLPKLKINRQEGVLGRLALVQSLSEPSESEGEPKHIYRSRIPMNKVINSKHQPSEPKDVEDSGEKVPENPTAGQVYIDENGKWKFIDNKWRLLQTKKYEGTETLNMFNRGKLDRPMLKAILGFSEKDIVSDFAGSMSRIGYNYLRKLKNQERIEDDKEIKLDPDERKKAIARSKSKFPNPQVGDEYRDDDTSTNWEYVLTRHGYNRWIQILDKGKGKKQTVSLSTKGEEGFDNDVAGKNFSPDREVDNQKMSDLLTAIESILPKNVDEDFKYKLKILSLFYYKSKKINLYTLQQKLEDYVKLVKLGKMERIEINTTNMTATPFEYTNYDNWVKKISEEIKKVDEPKVDEPKVDEPLVPVRNPQNITEPLVSKGTLLDGLEKFKAYLNTTSQLDQPIYGNKNNYSHISSSAIKGADGTDTFDEKVLRYYRNLFIEFTKELMEVIEKNPSNTHRAINSKLYTFRKWLEPKYNELDGIGAKKPKNIGEWLKLTVMKYKYELKKYAKENGFAGELGFNLDLD